MATNSPSDDGSNGNFYCINGGAIGGSAGSCTCTSCYDGVGGPHCETCLEGYTGDAPWCFLNCVSSANPYDDGSLEKDGNFYCINGGTVGGSAGNCRCTGCNEGFEGTHCATSSTCQATSTPGDGGEQGYFYCINGGSAGGAAGSCTCTCPEDFGDPNCATPLCPPGKYKEDEPTFTCTACPSGKFNTKYGGLSEADCTNCVPYTTSNTERTKCLSLGGYYIVEGEDWFQAFPVPEGFWSSQEQHFQHLSLNQGTGEQVSTHQTSRLVLILNTVLVVQTPPRTVLRGTQDLSVLLAKRATEV